jgi:hypothetical protein
LVEARLLTGPTGDDITLFASSTAVQATDARREKTFILMDLEEVLGALKMRRMTTHIYTYWQIRI